MRIRWEDTYVAGNDGEEGGSVTPCVDNPRL